MQAVVSIHNRTDNRNYIVPSNKMRVRIGAPHSTEEENDALVMLRDDVGAYLALGGSRVLEKARVDLDAVLARRSNDQMIPVDAVCANIIRCQGIDRGRNYLLLKGPERVPNEGNRSEAAKQLEILDDATLARYFDSNTAAATAALARKHRRQAGG